MIYASLTDLVDRYGESEVIQLTNPNEETPDEAEADKALNDASVLIDSYLMRYRLPLASVPEILKRCCCDIARYYLSQGDGKFVTDQVENAFKEQISWLKGVANGKMSIGIPDAAATSESQPSGGAVSIVSDGRIFSKDSLKDY